MSRNAEERWDFADFEGSEEEAVLTVQLSLTRLILKALREKGWTQARLAQAARCDAPTLSRVLSGEHNWTARTAGKLLYALGISAELTRVDPVDGTASGCVRIIRSDGTYGQEISTTRYSTGTTGRDEIRYQGSTNYRQPRFASHVG